MTSLANDFILAFHSIEGVTIADRKKALHQLFALNSQLPPEALDAISSGLKPESYLESLFKLEFSIHFRRKDDLLQVLKTGDAVSVSKVAKQSWFFKEAFSDLSADHIVNDILPSMSFVVRMKILNKLSRYATSNFDQIFNALVARYGVFLASKFLTGCSPALIRATLDQNPITFTSTQLRILHRKDPTLVSFYFSQKSNSIHDRKYKNLVKYLHFNDPYLFEELTKNHNYTFKLGRRATKKFLTSNKDAIIAKPHSYKNLDMKAVIRKLGKDSIKLFTNYLPVTVEPCLNRDWFFRSFPRKYRYSLFVKTFQAHYKINLAEHPHLIDEGLLRLVGDPQERATLAKAKVDQGREDYLKYLLVEEAVGLIKERINLTSDIHRRGELVVSLVETCRINDDVGALASVMKYFNGRHKNDDLSVHLEFINNVEERFGLKRFTEEMWGLLNELLMIHMLKFDRREGSCERIQTLPLLSYNLGIRDNQRFAYWEFLFKTGKPLDALLTDHFSPLPTQLTHPDFTRYDKAFSKHVLLFAINHLSKEDTVNLNCDLIASINRWNDHHKSDPLSFRDFPKLLNTFNSVIRTSCDIPHHILRIFRKEVFTREPNQEYLSVYWERFDHFGTLADIGWFLKYHPALIVANFTSVFNRLTSQDSSPLKLWYLMKKMTHLSLDVKSVQKCLALLNDANSHKYVPCLSVLMAPRDYANLADSHKPANRKLDLTNETEVRLYKLQCAIAAEFKNSHWEGLPFLLPYCVGDYFKSALRSLYSLLYRTPENELPPHLEHLSKQAVSVRKHALYLTCELATCAQVEAVMKAMNEREKDQSLRKYMFMAGVQYFVKNPSDQVFDLVKSNMLFVDKADEESLRAITDHLGKIPRDYKARYVQYAWEFVEETVPVWEKLRQLKEDLVSTMTDIVRQIPLEFAVGVVKKHFYTDKSLHFINDFIFSLFDFGEDKSMVFDVVFEILDRSEERQVFTFLRSLYGKVMKIKLWDVRYYQPYLDYYEKKVSPVFNFEDFVKVHLLKVKIDTFPASCDDLALKLASCLEGIAVEFGPLTTPLLAKELNASLGYFTSSDLSKYDLYESMIKQRPIPVIAVILLGVLKEPSFTDFSCHIRKFNSTLTIIKSIDDVGVQVNLYSQFKKYLDSTRFLF